jgi:hypothetical protein
VHARATELVGAPNRIVSGCSNTIRNEVIAAMITPRMHLLGFIYRIGGLGRDCHFKRDRRNAQAPIDARNYYAANLAPTRVVSGSSRHVHIRDHVVSRASLWIGDGRTSAVTQSSASCHTGVVELPYGEKNDLIRSQMIRASISASARTRCRFFD